MVNKRSDVLGKLKALYGMEHHCLNIAHPSFAHPVPLYINTVGCILIGKARVFRGEEIAYVRRVYQPDFFIRFSVSDWTSITLSTACIYPGSRITTPGQYYPHYFHLENLPRQFTLRQCLSWYNIPSDYIHLVFAPNNNTP